jgi:hypothetical protein
MSDRPVAGSNSNKIYIDYLSRHGGRKAAGQQAERDEIVVVPFCLSALLPFCPSACCLVVHRLTGSVKFKYI